MKKLFLTSIVLMGCSSAATVVSVTGGTYTIQAEDADVLSGLVVGSGAAGFNGTGFLDTTGSATYNFSGLDFASYTYTIDITTYARTGNSSGGEISIDPGGSTSFAQNSWTGAFTGYNLATDEALTTASFTHTTSVNSHIDEFDVTITATAIPEPSAMALLGLGGLAILARRKR